MNRKIYDIKLVTLILTLISNYTINAQLVNKGEMVIKEGTNDVITFFDFVNTVSGTLENDDHFYIKKNFTNQGKISHNNLEGTTFFVGTDKQLIKGGTQTYFKNVVFDNKTKEASDNSAFVLEEEINIEGKTDFKKGIVNNKTPHSGSIVLWEDATTVGAYDDSYVNGKVIKNFDKKTDFEFPIGAYKFDQYRFAGISSPAGTNRAVIAEYLYKNSNTSYPHSQKDKSLILIDNKEYWEISGTDQLVLTLSWDEDTTPIELLNRPNDIRIVKWNSLKNRWENLGGIPNPSSKTVTGPVQGEGIFTLGLVEEEGDSELVVYNGISANEDNLNDYFSVVLKRGGIINNLKVKIYNRWGVLVFQSNDYQSNKENTFRGYSNGRVTVAEGTLLVSGTYFYILDYDYDDASKVNHTGTKVGYLYIVDDSEPYN